MQLNEDHSVVSVWKKILTREEDLGVVSEVGKGWFPLTSEPSL